MKRFISRGLICVVALVAASFVTMNVASAGDHHRHGHRGGFRSAFGGSWNGGYGGYGGYNRGYGGNGGYGYTQPRWHDTSHYDYHPAQVVPHGNHYHVIPGHYDYHRTGHYHY